MDRIIQNLNIIKSNEESIIGNLNAAIKIVEKMPDSRDKVRLLSLLMVSRDASQNNAIMLG